MPANKGARAKTKPRPPRAEIGLLGGTGLYEIEGIRSVREHRLRTPFGDPSDAYVVGDLEGRRVAFLSRHGGAVLESSSGEADIDRILQRNRHVAIFNFRGNRFAEDIDRGNFSLTLQRQDLPVSGDAVVVERWETITDGQGNVVWKIWAHR